MKLNKHKPQIEKPVSIYIFTYTSSYTSIGVIISFFIFEHFHFQVIYVFGFGVPLFIDGAGSSNKVKWGLWIMHKLLLTAVYAFILFVHFSKWRDKLPREYISNFCCHCYSCRI